MLPSISVDESLMTTCRSEEAILLNIKDYRNQAVVTKKYLGSRRLMTLQPVDRAEVTQLSNRDRQNAEVMAELLNKKINKQKLTDKNKQTE